MTQRTLTKYENEIHLILTKINKCSKSLYVELMDDLDEAMYFFHLEDYQYLRNTLTTILRLCEKFEYYEICSEIVALEKKLIKCSPKI